MADSNNTMRFVKNGGKGKITINVDSGIQPSVKVGNKQGSFITLPSSPISLTRESENSYSFIFTIAENTESNTRVGAFSVTAQTGGNSEYNAASAYTSFRIEQQGTGDSPTPGPDPEYTEEQKKIIQEYGDLIQYSKTLESIVWNTDKEFNKDIKE